jgi:ketosteroid isomerase-like protein
LSLAKRRVSDGDNLATATRLYEAAARGDWAAAEAELHDELVIHEAASLPYGGTYRGKAALRKLVETVGSHFANPSFERTAMASGDGRVIAFFTIAFDTPAGRDTHEIVEVNEFRDGRIAVIKPFYWDTDTIAKLGRS